MISRKTLAGLAIIAAVLADRGRADAQTPALVSHAATDRDRGVIVIDNGSIRPGATISVGGIDTGPIIVAGEPISLSGLAGFPFTISSLRLLPEGGAGLAGAQSSAIRLGAAVSSAISDQAAFWRSGETVDPTGIVSLQSDAGALDAASERRWRAWGSFYGGAANVSPDAGRGSPAANSDYFGGLLGLDYQIEPSWLVGVAVGGSSSRFDVASLQTSGDITAFHGGLYTSYRVGRSYVELSETVSVFQNSTIRTRNRPGLTYDRFTADFSAREYRTRIEFGHGFDLPRPIELGSATLTPFAAAEAAVYESDAFSEKGLRSDVSRAFSIAEQTTTSLPTFLGLRVSNVLRLPNGWRVAPTASLAWGHEFFPQRRISGAFASEPTWTFADFGPRDAYNFVQAKIGLQAHIDDRVVLFANFQGEFSGLTRSYGGKGGLRYSW
ncbi:autotransporter outer membrane beta-barrel domain-containing protein [Methylosinus sp. Sm6]|uniref:autotransporter outer membrane beta-barrel domain-containing protein n=1 Tax=Methylosinus sp. Sm6 TaxID=2866948 RepID=UPI001C9A2879|nr:autotransporter outer membrane beta-barrel domain-containing protein [Methylosinus sp. Sm6]MBY6241020.1 autotransporter outer membrane beta-barrel domain-containing protein [Methylosinus sp. Sm6]